MTEPSRPRHPHDRPDEDDSRDTVDAGSVDDYAARVNAPLRPETIAEINRCIESGDAPQRTVRRRDADEQPASMTFCRCGNYAGNHPFPGCPSGEQPVRHTADTITDNDLDQLYAEIDRMKLLVAASSEPGHAVRMAAAATLRAERAEAVLGRLGAFTGAHKDSDQITIAELAAALYPPKETPDA